MKAWPALRSISNRCEPHRRPSKARRGDSRIDGELRRDGQRHLRADAAAQLDFAIAAHAMAVGDDMRIGRGQRANRAAGFVVVLNDLVASMPFASKTSLSKPAI